MVWKARDDFPLPLGPVTTVSLPRGRSISMPLRLFWRAPRISTQPCSAGAMPHSFGLLAAIFEPTGDNSRLAGRAQIYEGKNGISGRVVDGCQARPWCSTTPAHRIAQRATSTKAGPLYSPVLRLQPLRDQFALLFQL